MLYLENTFQFQYSLSKHRKLCRQLSRIEKNLHYYFSFLCIGFRHTWECGESAGQGAGHETAAPGQGSPRFRQARAGSGHRARRDGVGRGQAVSRGRRYPDAD